MAISVKTRSGGISGPLLAVNWTGKIDKVCQSLDRELLFICFAGSYPAGLITAEIYQMRFLLVGAQGWTASLGHGTSSFALLDLPKEDNGSEVGDC